MRKVSNLTIVENIWRSSYGLSDFCGLSDSKPFQYMFISANFTLAFKREL